MDFLAKNVNQMKIEDMKKIENEKMNILSRVTHVLDIDGWNVDGKIIYGEVSILDVKTLTNGTINLYHPEQNLAEKKMSKAVIWPMENIHGLKLCTVREFSYDFTLEQFFNFLNKDKDSLYAFKGGIIERDLCKKFNLNCLNLELFGCTKFEELLEYYYLPNKKCDRHLYFKGKLEKLHCPRYEVYVFSMFLFDVLGQNEKLNHLYNLYCKEKSF